MSDSEKLTIDQKIAIARMTTDLITGGLEDMNGIHAMMDIIPDGPLFPETFKAAYLQMVDIIKESH